MSRNVSQSMWSAAHLQSFVPDRPAVEAVPRAVAARYGIIPLRTGNGTITLGMRDTKDLEALDYVQMITQLRPEGVPVEEKLLREMIERIYGSGQSAEAEASIEKLAEQAARTTAPGEDGAVEMPIVRLFDRLLEEAVRAGTTDLHVQPNEEHLLVSFRVDGMMRAAHKLPAALAVPLATRIKVIANLDISERRLPQDGKISMFVGGKNVDLRVSTMLTLHGENVVIRILQQGSIRLGLGDLGFRAEDIADLKKLFSRPHGIVLTTGPTGSGKTTTLYAAMREIDCVTQNVMTLEDPVEYRLPRIRQSQINERAGFTFARGLRALMRQDPDVILVGEMRDKETTEIAVKAALTGHLVLSTLHTNSAIGTLSRLRNIGIEPFLVASTLGGVISQRLARAVCPNCRVPREATEAEKKLLGVPLDQPAPISEGKGCDRCGGFGMKGRRVVYEMLVLNDELSDLIAREADEGAFLEAARRHGFRTLRECARDLVLAGEIPIDAMTRVVV